MKINLFTSVFLLVFIPNFLAAQNPLKIAHVNTQELAQLHPSTDSIRILLEKETKEMESLYDEMIKEHDQKLGVFEKEKAGYSEFVRISKEKELIEMAKKIQEYNQTAQMQLQKRNYEMLKPVYEHINNLVKNIAQKELYTYVLETGNGNVAYISPESFDLNPQIKELIKNKKGGKIIRKNNLISFE